jgi:histone H3/H4
MKTEEFALQEIERQQKQQNDNMNDPTTSDNNKKGGNIFMISSEAPILMTKASELFIREISTRAWNHTDTNRRKTIQRADIYASLSESEVFDFLIDFIPRDLTTMTSNGTTACNTDGGTTPASDFAAHTTTTPAILPPQCTADGMMIAQPTVVDASAVADLPRDYYSYPTIGTEFLPVADENGQQTLCYPQQSQPWT